MSKVGNIFWVVAHPVRAVRAKERQVAVSIDHAQPPPGTSVEGFPGLPVSTAAKFLEGGGGVRLADWPKSVQTEMRGGREIHPDGRHPEHSNV
jgi:hypothetical protein